MGQRATGEFVFFDALCFTNLARWINLFGFLPSERIYPTGVTLLEKQRKNNIKEQTMKKVYNILEAYKNTLRNGRLNDFESKAIYAKVKHYQAILKKVDALITELNK